MTIIIANDPAQGILRNGILTPPRNLLFGTASSTPFSANRLSNK
jgi:hypothetical protein